MSEAHAAKAPPATLKSAAQAVWVTAGLHAVCTMTTAAPGVLAPVAARDFGLPVSQVGVMIALHYFATVPSGLASAALQARYGAVRGTSPWP